MVSGEQSQLVFCNNKCPESTLKGLFYGGGFGLLRTQLLGVVTVLAWTVVTMTIIFKVIDMTIGLRVSEEEEIVGLIPRSMVLHQHMQDSASWILQKVQ